MSDIIKIGLRLTIITLIAAILLGLTNQATADVIYNQKLNIEKQAKLEVLPDAEEFTLLDVPDAFIIGNGTARIIEVAEGKMGEKVVGYTVKAASKGFGGDIEFVIGISAFEPSNVSGVKILSHQETPGLGAKAEEAAFVGQYSGKRAVMFKVIKNPPNSESEIQAITGATISSVAVTNGVNYAIEAVEQLTNGEEADKNEGK